MLVRAMSLPSRPLNIPRPPVSKQQQAQDGAQEGLPPASLRPTSLSTSISMPAPRGGRDAPVCASAPIGHGAAAMAAQQRARRERLTIQGMDAYEYCDMIRSL